MKITFLGTGTSHGVPSLDCMIEGYARCPKGVCRLALQDERHRRTRSSVLLEKEGKAVLADVSADFRQQALRENIKRIDAVLLTHAHADHIGGIPDIRSYTKESKIPFYASAQTIEQVRRTFSYIFDPGTFEGGGIPRITTRVVESSFKAAGMEIVPVPVRHGAMEGCYGYRIENVAYIPDVKHVESRNESLLKGLDCLILNCLRDEREHSTHLILPQSMELARRLAPKRCFFIHMSHDIHYEIDSGQLDSWMNFSYDGLQVEV
ncbi:MAG: MBL fold metallo-hydrolase [Chitinispirillaceae bacterium]